MAIPIKAVLSVSTKAFTGGFKLASKALGGFISLAKSAAVAVVGLSGAIVALTLRQAALIDRLGKISDVVGLSTELIQKFGFAAEQAGVSFDQSSVALRRFSRRLGEAQKGTGELLPALRRLGINVKNADGSFKSAEEVLFEFADGIANVDDASQRLALAFKAFDSEGAELVKTLADGSSGLKDFFDQAEAFGLILSRSAIKGVEDFNDSLNLLIKTLSGQFSRVVAAFAPDLQKLTNFLAESIKNAAEAAGGYDNLARILRDKVLDILIAMVKFMEKFANAIRSVGQGLVWLAQKIGNDPFIGLGPEATEAAKKIQELDKALEDIYSTSIMGDALVVQMADLVGLGDEARVLYNKLALTITKFFKGGDFSQQSVAALLEQIQTERDRLNAIVSKDKGIFGDAFDFSETADLLESLKGGVAGTVEQVKEFKVATTETNRELDLTLGYWERIGLKIKDFLTQDLPEAVKASTEAIKNTLKTVAERLAELSDPVKTIEDGLVKAGQAFEDALVDAIMTGKANFEDFKQLLKETFARAIVQKFITGPIFDMFKAKGGPVKAGQPYVVGEEGPELFVPGASGTIVPNNKMASPNAIQGGQPTQITYNINAIDSASFEQRLAQNPEYLYNLTQVGARRQPA